MATSPYQHPLIYKSLIFSDGSESPGKVTLSGHDQLEEWEKQRAKGTTGTTTINHGQGVNEFSATFELADDEDRDGWERMCKFLRSTTSAGGGGKPKAIGVYHPDLVAQLISDCVVTSIGGLVHDSKGGSKGVVKFLPYRPPKPKAASKAAAGGVRQGKTVLDPNALAKRELELLLAQAKEPL